MKNKPGSSRPDTSIPLGTRKRRKLLKKKNVEMVIWTSMTYIDKMISFFVNTLVMINYDAFSVLVAENPIFRNEFR